MAANSLERGLVTWLLTETALTALVVDRIYPQMAPQAPTYPCLIYTRTGTDRARALNAGDTAPTARLELTAWGGRGPGGYDVAKRLAAALVPILEGYRDAAGLKFVHYLYVDDEADVAESAEFASFDDPRGVQFRVSISYDETLTNTAP